MDKLDFVGVPSTDADRSRQFYVETLGLRADGRPADETTPATLADMVGHYKRSKYLAEEAVRELIDRHGLPAVIVNPSAPVRPPDRRPTPPRPCGRPSAPRAPGRATSGPSRSPALST